jgi:hypothetical protein
MRRDDIDDFDMLHKGMSQVSAHLDVKKLIKNVRLIKLMSQILMSKGHRKFVPYLQFSHIDYQIFRSKQRKFEATFKGNTNDLESTQAQL